MNTEKKDIRKWTLPIALGIGVLLVVGACNIPIIQTPSAGDPVEQAMQTLQAQATQEYFATIVAQLTATAPVSEAQPTHTLPVSANETQVQPTATLQAPTATQPAPTSVPPTATPIPPTPTPIPCNQVSFVSDVTIPDGTKIVAGTSFTKTWKLKNTGSCTWNDQYDVAFVDGTQMSSAKIYDLPKIVKPGETVELSIEMTAPITEGKYTAKWMLVNPNGVKFGTGAQSTGTFWVKIEAVDGKGAVYSFAQNACDARWSTSKQNPIICPGKETSVDDGYVLTKNAPLREDGGKENEIGLITRPDDASDGYIQGIYPAFPVKDGDRFKAAIQCEYDSPKCDLKFELYYRIGDGKFIELGEWHESYEGLWTNVDIDLSALAGQKVQFSLVVWNRDTSVDNRGLWLNPLIVRTK